MSIYGDRKKWLEIMPEAYRRLAGLLTAEIAIRVWLEQEANVAYNPGQRKPQIPRIDSMHDAGCAGIGEW